MARRSLGSGSRLLFGVIGLALFGIALLFWLTYLVKPVRALAQGEQTTVTVTRCGASKGVTTCYATWGGKTPGHGELAGRADPGTRMLAHVYHGAAYPMRSRDWTERGVLVLVGLGFAVVARYLVGAAVGRAAG
ncbi:MAG: hypothetical protein HY241_15720 [Actinobacteria bacterium]|nr:hypothetical protein [Actinomycetota bacterium]